MQPASIDLTLGSHFLKVDENAIDRITLPDRRGGRPGTAAWA